MRFSLSGVQVNPIVPFAAALGISTFTSLGGVSGTFILLAFQVSVLGFSGPAVTATNHLINVIGIPAAIFRFAREGRLLWPLTAVIVAGTLPGVVLGAWMRATLLADARRFKLFIGLVLLSLGLKMAQSSLAKLKTKLSSSSSSQASGPASAGPSRVTGARLSWRELRYEYRGEVFRASTPALAALTIVVGVIGGAYGMGGAAIIAPLLISVFRLPVHTIAGATLTGNFATSLFGVVFFTLLDPLFGGGVRLTPDWLLGALFGAGSMSGMYLGARLQKKVPSSTIELLLAAITTAMGVNYIVGFFY